MSPGEPLYQSQTEKDELEARNGRLQFRRVVEIINHSHGILDLTPGIIKELQYLAIKDIYPCAGQFRARSVKILKAPHKPPEHRYVEELVQDMCEVVRANADWDAVKTAAYLLWRINWIHPFIGGNGRTARAVSYVALCVRAGLIPPGSPTIPELILRDQFEFEAALKDADEAHNQGILDVSKMENLLNRLLEERLSTLTD